MKQVTGDLLVLAKEGKFDVIVHGCNCFCTMGAGIAKLIKIEFPEAYAADLKTKSGDAKKLGSYSVAKIHRDGVNFLIVNAYTQFDWRGRGVKANYEAIRSAFARIRENFPSSRIAYPLIGAGLARGDWEEISRIIDEELDGLDHTLVKLNGVLS